MPSLFKNRVDAGRDLALALESYRGPATLVLGLPRGGVVVAAEVARVLGAELNAIVTRKVGAPGNPEYALGAVAEGGVVVLNDREIAEYHIARAFVEQEVHRQEEEIQRRVELYRNGTPLPPMQQRPVLVVDDGVATGYTMLAALRAVKRQGAHPIVMATPVTPIGTLERLQVECDNAVVLATPEPFYAVGLFYEDFAQVSDRDVVRLLKAAKGTRAA